MKSIINLKEVITKGHFGGVKLGMTVEKVKEILGKPPYSQKMNENELIFCYGFYKILFNNYAENSGQLKVVAFQNDSFQYENGFDFENAKIKIEPWFFNHKLKLKEVKRSIDKEGINYQISKKYDFIYLVFESGSKIGFLENSFSRDDSSLHLIEIGF